MKRNKRCYRQLWMLLVIFILTVISLYSTKAAMISAVALEQSTRCGQEEHIHSVECYDSEGIRTCVKEEHVHGQNCYLLLLEENDINVLLEEIDHTEDKSLEGVLSDVVGRAVTLNENVGSETQTMLLSSGTESTASEARDTITELNTTIEENSIQPGLVLNESFASVEETQTNMSLSGSNLALLTLASPSSSSGNAQTYAVGDRPATSNQNVNFYVNIDGSWTCIGTLPYTLVASGWRYYRTVTTSEIIGLIYDSMGVTVSQKDMILRYCGTLNGNYDSTANIGNTNTTFGRSDLYNPIYARLMTGNNQTAMKFYSVTFLYEDGTREVRYARENTSINLLDDADGWTDGTDTYEAGQSYKVTGTKTFTEVKAAPPEPVTWLQINYDINFPTVSGVTVATKPTISGTAGNSYVESLSEGLGTTIKNVSQQEVKGKVNGNSTDLSRIIRFSGWRVGNSDVILTPNIQLSWEELVSYASGNYLDLTAVWEYKAMQTASFFIRFDSIAVDTEGNMTGQDSNKYTDELFATYVGNVTSDNATTNTNNYGVADTTSDNSYGADQAIRALHGPRTEGVWLQSFPNDEDIFEMLKGYTSRLSVDNIPVKVEDLNENGYAIRWYVFKCQDDAWHIDGKLLRKEGMLRVSKTFSGNKQVIAEAKENFYIDARNADRQVRLTLDDSGLKYKSYDEATDTYTWEIEDVVYGEDWTVSEYPGITSDDEAIESDHHVYSEYIIVDVAGEQATEGAIAGTEVSVKGMTYAFDKGVDEVMQIAFTNIYHTNNSIVLKKQDARTGVSIGGAKFQILQDGELMRFTYDSDAERYQYDPGGDVTTLTGTSNGYFEIYIDEFSYDLGNIVIREVRAPDGYSPIGDVEIGYVDEEQSSIGMISDSPMASYNNGILLLSNSTDTTSVTVEKSWGCPQSDWRDVTVQLLANGRLVTSLLPNVAPTAVLTAENGYTYTWSDLPAYANGVEIEWSVRETKIGTERCKSDYTFANWLVSYSLPFYTYNEDGIVTNTRFVVTNDTRRTMLRLTKTDMKGTTQLPGAEFTLQLLLEDGTADRSFMTRTAVTGSDGTLLFDNLLYGRYVLTETSPPESYLQMPELVYFTIGEDGTITVEESVYAKAGSSAFHIVVKNEKADRMPGTGGNGAKQIYIFGTLFAMMAFLINKATKNKRKGA